MKSNPIGIFDSGIGGLTIAHNIKKRLPYEKIIYLVPQFYIFKDMLADLLEINMIRSTLDTQYGEDANVIRREVARLCITMPTLSQVVERDSKQLKEIIKS